MSRLAIIPMLLLALGGEHERGLQLYSEGKFAEAAAAFRAAIAQDGDSAGLQWNLARACFAAGEFEAAEVAAEKYAALAKEARADLHLGMLGAVRHAQAKTLAAAAETPPPPAAVPQGNAGPAAAAPADPLPQLEQALAKAKDAGDYYERAAEAQPAPELLRNLERSQRLQQALAARIDELKKQREQQQSEDKEKDPEQKDQGDKKPDEKNKDDEKKPEDKKDDDKKQDDKKDDKQDKSEQEQKGEPEQKKPGEEPKGEPKPEDVKSEQEQGAGDKSEQPPEPQGNGGDQQQPDKDQKGQQPPEAGKDGKDGASAPPVGAKPEDAKGAAGAPKPATELTPEQAQQLMERLQKLDERLRAVRARARSGRPPVERDW
jgi:tetratricopeptide (TPR) repeat protein